MTEPESPAPRDIEHWARPVDRLHVEGVAAGAHNLNVDGRQLTGPLKGFGQMWQRTYRVRLPGVTFTPEAVIAEWKANFPKFWLPGNRFYGTPAGIAPGEVAVLNLAGPLNLTGPGEAPLIYTGIRVIFADDVSFSFMTPEGHIVAGMNVFSAFVEEGVVIAQVQCLVRPSDPLYELSARMGLLYRTEDNFWRHTVESLAAHLGVKTQAVITTRLVDSQVQWSQAGAVWHNAAVRTALHMLGAPVRWLGRLLRGVGRSG
jgi:hypothetical protein